MNSSEHKDKIIFCSIAKRGSFLGSAIAQLFPENVIGFHSNMCVVNSPLTTIKSVIASFYPTYFVEKEHENFFFPLSEKFENLLLETGYFHLQATKPDTIGAPVIP